MLRKFAKQLIMKKTSNTKSLVTSPFENKKSLSQKKFLLGLSKHALDLYEKKSDINRFTELALSDPQDLSHIDIVEDLNIPDFDDIFDLADNQRFLKDLGL